ncbi:MULTISPECIES: type II secretion system GspH family protein [Pseudomonas]|uniref:Type II secretory pathway pseudopilin PulG n=1 Tax=Pseudomonas hunanensis TaxID=1247546 RepID=A0ACC6K1T0_9PSED|nr:MULTISPECIES: type II secretion system GspH family protein [Pseudomonas]MBP2262109.1 type II secretory pathway pseudopilin PulG [Pseudomonas sp. BP8]MDR6712401.1 type II secretory pathway pseudopilin PulG [Pseudomonas hunanensis]HDS1735312.1 type II secretion system protein [Pseudomonas putida]
MAASMQSGKACAGFTYLGVLWLIAVSSMALAASANLWSTSALRERERQLLWVGGQYAQALRSYYRASPGLAQYPQALEELLEDNRFPSPRRHIRRLYPDPIAIDQTWGLLRSIDGRITGVYSRADDAPLKRSGFDAQWAAFEGLERYSDWQFVAEQAFAEGGTGSARRSGKGEAP